MAQHDYVISNDDGASVRTDINDVLAAIKSNSSHASAEPSSPVAGMPWIKTVSATVQEFYIHDGTQFVLVCTINPTTHAITFNNANKPSFFAHKNGTNQTNVANNTTTVMTWPTESWDEGGYFASNTWTPPAGKCRVTVVAEVSGVTDQTLYLVTIGKDGSEAAAGSLRGSGTGNITVTASALFDASGSNAFTARLASTEATNKTVIGTATRTYFFGEMV